VATHKIIQRTKRRILKKWEKNPKLESLTSYLDLLSHGNTKKLLTQLEKNKKI